MTGVLHHRVYRIVAMLIVALLAVPLAFAQNRPSDDTSQETTPTIEAKTAGMEKIDGFFPLYWDEKAGTLWMEIARFDTEVLHMGGLAAGLGSNDIGLDRGQMGGSRIVTFERVGPKILMAQPNYRYRAVSDNADEVRAVEDAFARSILWGFKVAAETDGRVLVDMTGFLIRDTHNIIPRLRPGTYKLDATRSALYRAMTMNFPQNTEMEVTLTFTRAPGGGGGFGGGNAFEGVGSVSATSQAVTLRVHHSFVELPDDNYTPRAFDPRAGYGAMTYRDYAVSLGEPIRKRLIRRHRLECAGARGADGLCDPVEPIIYYLDRGTPEPVRSALLDGARWWNQAFEAAGFRDGYRVELLPEGASSFDIRYNVINWVHRSTRGWSYGGSVTDPRTGEIIKGVVTLGSLRVRQDYMIAEGLLAPYENGTETPPELAAWALARIRQLSAHEVGHTLGLSHNYYNSEAGRISVLDYPHPLITLNADGSFDYGDVYDADIGEWDNVAIDYGYRDFSDGTNETEVLTAILNEAWDQDIRFLTNQDINVNPKADQWSNGTNAAAELTRMLAVRRAALDRFGERVIKHAMPMATMEDVLVPLYMHHRYQVDAAASTLGGVHYLYTFRGDGRDPVRWASAEEQRAALESLVQTISPAELALPTSVLENLPPRPPGYRRTRELFPRYTGPVFDAITPAVVASAHTFSNIFREDRAARLVEQHALDASLPGLQDVISRLVDATFGVEPANAYEAEISRAVERVFVDRLLALAHSAPMSQVRAMVSYSLEELASHLRAEASTMSVADAAHYQLLGRDIARFFERPGEPYILPATQAAPPGAPIGEPAMEWLLPLEPQCSHSEW